MKTELRPETCRLDASSLRFEASSQSATQRPARFAWPPKERLSARPVFHTKAARWAAERAPSGREAMAERLKRARSRA